MTDDSDLRRSVIDGNIDFEDFENTAVKSNEVTDGKIFGLTAVQRMIMSIVLFLTVSVLGIALLFVTGTIAIR